LVATGSRWTRFSAISLPGLSCEIRSNCPIPQKAWSQFAGESQDDA
jgi:hypothetical protein